MKIIVVGGSGEVGSAVVRELQTNHKVITAGRNSGDVKVDITDLQSIDAMYKNVGEFDALISTTGSVHFGPFEKLTDADCFVGLQNKLMGQVNLVLKGLLYIKPNGSFTLTSGILSEDPIKFGTSAAMVNGAIDGFIKGAAIEMSNGVRINSVSPTVLKESLPKYAAYFPGYEAVSAERVALAYRKSVDGVQTGQVYRVW